MEPRWISYRGEFDGSYSTITGELSDGYLIDVSLQRNEDGLLVCVGMNLRIESNQQINSGINTRYLQELGIGRILNSAREAYVEAGGFLEGLSDFRESEKQIKEWPNPGAKGHTDEKYAHLAKVYENTILRGSKNPIDEMAEYMNCERETAASRIAEARNRDLLTRPLQGQLGGRLTKKAERLLAHSKKGKGKNAKKSK